MIPQIIHLLFPVTPRDHERGFHEDSWRRHHPGWSIRAWDPDALAAYLSVAGAPGAGMLDRYTDLDDQLNVARYLILKHFGGLCVSREVECLRSFEPLRGSWPALGALAPYEQPRKGDAPADQINGDDGKLGGGLSRDPSPTPSALERVDVTLLASIPGHPLWDLLLRLLPQNRLANSHAARTGAELFSQALVQSHPHTDFGVFPPETLYPFSQEEAWCGASHRVEQILPRTKYSFTNTHWGLADAQENKTRRSGYHPAIPLDKRGVVVTPGAAGRDAPVLEPDGARTPLISCLMITRDRGPLARLAIQSFLSQSYPELELVIVDHGSTACIEEILEEHRDQRIRHICLPALDQPIGALRNVSLEHARGHYIATWDDDDLYDPDRIALTYEALRHAEAHACMMARQLEWWPSHRRLWISHRRPWENTLLCQRSIMPQYRALRRQSDKWVVEWLRENTRVAVFDQPRLYTRVIHGTNTWPAEHFEEHWELASERFEDENYDLALSELSKRVELGAYRR